MTDIVEISPEECEECKEWLSLAGFNPKFEVNDPELFWFIHELVCEFDGPTVGRYVQYFMTAEDEASLEEMVDQAHLKDSAERMVEMAERMAMRVHGVYGQAAADHWEKLFLTAEDYGQLLKMGVAAGIMAEGPNGEFRDTVRLCEGCNKWFVPKRPNHYLCPDCHSPRPAGSERQLAFIGALSGLLGIKPPEYTDASAAIDQLIALCELDPDIGVCAAEGCDRYVNHKLKTELARTYCLPHRKGRK